MCANCNVYNIVALANCENQRYRRTHEAIEEGREVEHRAPACARIPNNQRMHLRHGVLQFTSQ